MLFPIFFNKIAFIILFIYFPLEGLKVIKIKT